MTFDEFTLFLLAFTAAYWCGHFMGRAAGRKERPPAITVTEQLPALPTPAELFGQMQKDFDAPVAIGSRFSYMGLTIICTAHKVPTMHGLAIPGIRGEYIDRDGRIVSAVFMGDDLIALKAELRRAEVEVPA